MYFLLFCFQNSHTFVSLYIHYNYMLPGVKIPLSGSDYMMASCHGQTLSHYRPFVERMVSWLLAFEQTVMYSHTWRHIYIYIYIYTFDCILLTILAGYNQPLRWVAPNSFSTTASISGQPRWLYLYWGVAEALWSYYTTKNQRMAHVGTW